MHATFRSLGSAAALLSLLALPACSKNSSGTNNPAGPMLELNSQPIANGTSFAHPFNTAGQFPYHCSIHPVMTGVVTVTQAGAAVDSVDILNNTATGFSPMNVAVGVGGTVTWRNKSGITHTVTSN